MLAQIDHADILIAQVCNGGSKLSFQEVRDVVTRLSVKIIIPAHCGSGNTLPFARFMAGSSVKSFPDGTLVVALEDLEQIKSPQIIVLDH